MKLVNTLEGKLLRQQKDDKEVCQIVACHELNKESNTNMKTSNTFRNSSLRKISKQFKNLIMISA